MFMVLSSWPIATARVHPIHLTNVGQRRAAADPPTKPTDLGVESACIGCYNPSAVQDLQTNDGTNFPSYRYSSVKL